MLQVDGVLAQPCNDGPPHIRRAWHVPMLLRVLLQEQPVLPGILRMKAASAVSAVSAATAHQGKAVDTTAAERGAGTKGDSAYLCAC